MFYQIALGMPEKLDLYDKQCEFCFPELITRINLKKKVNIFIFLFLWRIYNLKRISMKF